MARPWPATLPAVLLRTLGRRDMEAKELAAIAHRSHFLHPACALVETEVCSIREGKGPSRHT